MRAEPYFEIGERRIDPMELEEMAVLYREAGA